MYNILMCSLYFYIFILTLKMTEGNRWKWSNAGNSLGRWNLAGSGGFNRLQQESFKNTTDIPDIAHRSNFNQEDTNNYNNQALRQPSRSTYLNQRTEGSPISCPPLPKRTGVELKCVSMTPVPWDPTSHVIFQSDCTIPQDVGTEAFYNCEQYYEFISKFPTKYRKCQEDGTWTGSEQDSFFTCVLECGKQNPVIRQPRISNGQSTYEAQWPWHATLFHKYDVYETQFHYHCGGTLINRQAVLTSATCVTLQRSTVEEISKLRIDLGRRHRTLDDEYVQSYSAKEIIIHPNYNQLNLDSDIAIIILEKEVPIGYHVRPICYPQIKSPTFDKLEGTFGTVVGFGEGKDGVRTEQLHMAKLKVVSKSECNQKLSEQTFCAGLQNETNVCRHDTGGGMYFTVDTEDTPRWYLHGLLSPTFRFERRCVLSEFAKFTRISLFSDWVVSVLSENGVLF